MDFIFDYLPTVMAAFGQSIYLLFGALFSLIGLAFIWGDLHWWIKGQRVEAQIEGVRYNGKVYHTVYSYLHPVTGETIKATSSSGSSLTGNRETGKYAPLLMMLNDPQNVKEKGGVWLFLFGAVFFCIGIGFLHQAFADLKNMPWAILIFIILFVAPLIKKIRKIAIPKSERLTPTAWKDMRRQKRTAKEEMSPMRPIEEYTQSPEALQQRRTVAKSSIWIVLLLLAISGGLGYGGYKTGHETYLLETHGIRAEGSVTALESRRGKDQTTYAAVVQFVDQTGEDIKFTDAIFSSPAAYRVGEKVTVMYLAEAPNKKVSIDRGWMNWLLPCGLGFGSALLLIFGLKLYGRYRAAQTL